jgi:hypothetical protein
MSNQLTMRKKQTSHKTEYMPAESSCYCGSCSIGTAYRDCDKTDGIFDWTVANITCCGGLCTDQRLCAHPDSDECNIGNDSTGRNALVYYGWDGEAPNLKCVYDLNKIDTKDQVDNFTRIWGNNDNVMAAYCERPSGACPEGMESCSRLKSIDEGSDMCRNWYATLASDRLRDAAEQNYCFRYNTEDCRCVNRTLTEEYNILKKGNPINDKCWFIPCSNPSRYFVPSELTNGTCPENVCEIVFDIYKNRDVKIYDNDFVCNFGPPGNPIIDLLTKYWAPMALVIIIYAMWTVVSGDDESSSVKK